MTTGEKIKKIRQFRKLKQTELGARLDIGDRAANRLAQYEMGYRVPKKDLLDSIAHALDVNPLCLYEVTGENAEEIMEILFWLEESQPDVIRLFQMQKFPREKNNASSDTGVYYHNNDSWPTHSPVGLWFSSGLMNEFLAEWQYHKDELLSGTISCDEYFEWKIGWPYTCDGCGKYAPKKAWRTPVPPPC